MITPDLTERQAEILGMLIDYLVEHQAHLTLRALGDRLGIGSTAGVADHLHALERKGYVAKGPKGSSGRRIIRWPDGRPFVLRAA